MDGKDENGVLFATFGELMTFFLFMFMLGFMLIDSSYKEMLQNAEVKIDNMKNDAVSLNMDFASKNGNNFRNYCWPKEGGKVGTDRPLIKVYVENDNLIMCPNMTALQWSSLGLMSAEDKLSFEPIAPVLIKNFGKPIPSKSFSKLLTGPVQQLRRNNAQCYHGAVMVDRKGEDGHVFTSEKERVLWPYFFS